MQTDEIERALAGRNGDVNRRIHYVRMVERKAPYWLEDLLKERKLMVETLKRISVTPTAGFGAALASRTLREIGEDDHVEINPPSA